MKLIFLYSTVSTLKPVNEHNSVRELEANEGSITLFTYGRDCCDNFSQLELVKDGGFSSSVKSDHEDAHLLFAEEAFE